MKLILAVIAAILALWGLKYWASACLVLACIIWGFEWVMSLHDGSYYDL